MKVKEKKPKKKTKLSVRILTILTIVFFVAGISLVLYPYVSNTIGKIEANNVIDEFEEQVDSVIDMSFDEAVSQGVIDEEGYPINEKKERKSNKKAVFKGDLDKLHKDSLAYNKSLTDGQGTPDYSDFSKAVLDLSSYRLSNTVYAYISAPAINMKLPIYLGASDYNMSYGAAHVAGTSLPLDEKDTNSVIAAHTGYIGRIFFDNIKSLTIGDEVSIKNYWETIDYEVIDKKVIDKSDGRDLYIEKGRQLLTLMTCTPDGNGGYDRYLVICEKK